MNRQKISGDGNMGVIGNSSVDINNLTKSFLICMDLLVNFFRKENKLLSQGDVLGVKRIIDKKYEILLNFQNIESQIQLYLRENNINGNKNVQKMLSQAKVKYAELSKLMQENEILLRSNIEVSERIIEMYNSSRVERVVNQFGYGSDGKISATQNLEKIMPSISLNNKI